MKIVPLSIIIIFLSISLINCKSEKKQWVSLFNGVDLDNWHVKIKGHPLGVNYKNTHLQFAIVLLKLIIQSMTHLITHLGIYSTKLLLQIID